MLASLSALNILIRFEPRNLTHLSKVAIEVVRESLHFSAAHFTIFSASERENLHGHNFRLNGTFESEIQEDGLCFDYGKIKAILQELCDELDERFLVPERSPYLDINTENGVVRLTFDGESMTLPARDVRVLPVRNITVEELATWIAERLIVNELFASLKINRMQIKVASGSGQWGVVTRDLS